MIPRYQYSKGMQSRRYTSDFRKGQEAQLNVADAFLKALTNIIFHCSGTRQSGGAAHKALSLGLHSRYTPTIPTQQSCQQHQCQLPSVMLKCSPSDNNAHSPHATQSTSCPSSAHTVPSPSAPSTMCPRPTRAQSTMNMPSTVLHPIVRCVTSLWRSHLVRTPMPGWKHISHGSAVS